MEPGDRCSAADHVDPHYSWRFVTKWLSRVARRARGDARAEAYLKQYVEGPSGEPARLHTPQPVCRLVAAADQQLQ